MPYYVAIRAYGVGDNADSNVTESSPPELGTPNNLYASLNGTDVDVEWDYTYLLNDDLQGFRVYIGYNPIPQWGDATDTGMTGGNASYPTEHFTVAIPNTWYGDVYVCVEARGAGTQTYSTVIPLMLPPKPVYDVQVDGVADETLRWASDLRVTTRATEDPACDLRGVPIPTVTDFVAGGNVTVNVTGRTVEISATGGGVTPKEPDDISGLSAWYDATTLTGLSDNDEISTWPDISGNSRDATQATSARRPHYKLAGINGMPSVFLDGVSRVGLVTSYNIANPFSIFYVAQPQSTAGPQRYIQGASNNWLIGPYSGTWQWYSGAFATTLGTPTVGRTIIHGVTQASASGAHFLCDPTLSTTLFPIEPALVVSATRASPGAPGAMVIGGDGAYDDYPNGYVGEIVVYNRQLSYEEGAGLIMHLKDKWGI